MIELLLVQPLPVTDALDAMRAAYAESSVADSMTYETRRSDGTFDSISAVLRITDTEHGRLLRYETSGFAFYVQPGSLVGAGGGPPEPRRVLVAKREGQPAAEILTSVVPTGPLPQLWTARGTAVSDPVLGAIRFATARREQGTTTILGDTAFGPVRVETDTTTGRLLTLRAPLRDGTIELRAAPTEPGDSQAWTIDTENKRLVSRIDQLAPNLAILGMSDILPDVSLQDPEGVGLTLAEWHESPPEGAPRAPWSLVLFADATSTSPADALRDATELLTALERTIAARQTASAPAERFWLRYRPLVVLVMPEGSAFDIESQRPDLAAIDVLYSTRPDLTIDRLPLARIVAVAIDRDRVIGAVGAMNDGAEAPSLTDEFVDQLLAPVSNASE